MPFALSSPALSGFTDQARAVARPFFSVRPIVYFEDTCLFLSFDLPIRSHTLFIFFVPPFLCSAFFICSSSSSKRSFSFLSIDRSLACLASLCTYIQVSVCSFGLKMRSSTLFLSLSVSWAVVGLCGSVG